MAVGFQGISVLISDYFTVKVVDQFGIIIQGADVVITDNNDVKDTLELTTNENGIANFLADGWSDFDIYASAECFEDNTQRFQSSDDIPFVVTLNAYVDEGLFINPENEYNFIRWHKATGLSFPISNPPEFIKRKEGCETLSFSLDKLPQQYCPILEPGEEVSFFCNLPDGNRIDIGGIKENQSGIVYPTDKVWKLKIVDCNFNELHTFNVKTIAEPGRVYVGTFYGSFNVPALSIGGYYLVIDDVTNNNIQYISNQLQVVSENQKKRQTKRLKYRNSDDIYNFYYGELENFENKIRIDLVMRQYQVKEEMEGYRDSTGRWIRVFSNVRGTREAIPQFIDEDAHRAFAAATQHNDFKIDTERYINTDESDYTIDWQNNEELAGGAIRLEQEKYYRQNRTC